MNPQVEQFVREIRQKLPSHGSPESAAAAYRQSIITVFGHFPAEMEANLSEALDIVRNTLQSVEIIRRNSLAKPRDNWYVGPGATDLHWPALEGYLENEKRWDRDSIDSINESSSEVVSLLANPSQEQFRCKGLVVGYVQSGKTGQDTAAK